ARFAWRGSSPGSPCCVRRTRRKRRRSPSTTTGSPETSPTLCQWLRARGDRRRRVDDTLTPLPGILRSGRRQVVPENLVDDVVEEASVIRVVGAVLRTCHPQNTLVAERARLRLAHDRQRIRTTTSSLSRSSNGSRSSGACGVRVRRARFLRESGRDVGALRGQMGPLETKPTDELERLRWRRRESNPRPRTHRTEPLQA